MNIYITYVISTHTSIFDIVNRAREALSLHATMRLSLHILRRSPPPPTFECRAARWLWGRRPSARREGLRVSSRARV